MSTNYDVITLSPGQHETVSLGSGETFENVLIDQTARNCSYTISAQANNWTIRNVGWVGSPEGANNAGGAGQDYLILCGGNGTIENVYMNGKGSPRTYFGAIYFSVAHSGHIDIENTFVSGFGNNACYANMPAASSGSGGTVAFRNCYHRDSTPANFRPGANGSTINNCLSITNDPSGERGMYYSNDSQYCRGIWHWDGRTVTVEDSTVYVSPNDVQPGPGFVCRNQHGSNSHVDLDVNNCYVNPDIPTLSMTQERSGSASVNFSGLSENPTATIIGNGGVPMSAEQAASGGRQYPDPFNEGIGDGGGDPPDDPNLTSIDLTLDDTSIEAGSSTDATVTASYDDGSTANVTSSSSISSSNTSVASVSGRTINGTGDGSATITANFESESDSETIQVTEDDGGGDFPDPDPDDPFAYVMPDPPSDEPVDRSQMTVNEINPSDGADLSSYVADLSSGELLRVAPGNYTWTQQSVSVPSNCGIQGDPNAEANVVINLDDGWGFASTHNLGVMINAGSSGNVIVENLHLDSNGRTSPGFRAVPSSGNGVLFHHIIDHAPGTTTGGVMGTNMFLLGGDGDILIDRCVEHQRGNIHYSNNSQSFFAMFGTNADVTVRRCKASGYGDNIVYSRSPGPLTVDNCVFANTTPSCIRMGGDNEIAQNCTFYMDTDGRELYNTDGTVNTRLIAGDNGGAASNGGHIENCSFIVESTPNSSGAVATIGGSFSGMNIRDSQFMLNQGNIPGVNGPSGSMSNLVFDTDSNSGATAVASGSWSTSNISVANGLNAGVISPDSSGAQFDWDAAHDFPDPTTAEAFYPVDLDGPSGDPGEPDPEPDPDPEYLYAERFEHNDLHGRYGGNVSDWTISNDQLQADSSSASPHWIMEQSRQVEAGETYTCEFTIPDGSEPDFGVGFGAPSTQNFGSVSTYLVFINDSGLYQDTTPVTEIIRIENGTRMRNVTTEQVPPRGEPVRMEIDYRDSSSDTIAARFLDEDGSELYSLSMSGETEFGDGYFGFHHHFPDDVSVDRFVKGTGDGIDDPVVVRTGSVTGANVTQMTYDENSETEDTEFDVSAIAASSVTMNGEVTTLNVSQASVAFDFRQTGSSSWARTDTLSMTSADTFEISVENLDPDTEYEYRAVGLVNGSVESMGATRTFTTGIEQDPDPESYESWSAGPSALDKYEGGTGGYSVINSRARAGDYSATSDGGHDRILYPGGDGPERGERFAQSFYPAHASDDRFMLHFAVQDDGSDSRYALTADHAQGALRLGIYNNGTWDWPAGGEESFNTSGTADQWNELRVDFGQQDDGVIGFSYETPEGDVLAEGSYQDSLFSGGGWGYSLWTNASDTSPDYYIDYLRDDGTIDDPNAPEPPVNVHSPSQTETTAELEWSHSPDQNELDNYTVYLNGIKSHEEPPSSSSTTVQGLSAGTTYTLGVSAVIGNQESSQATTEVTTEESDEPPVDLADWVALPATEISEPTDFSQDLPIDEYGLSENTRYEYVAHATDQLGEPGYIGAIRSFETGEIGDPQDPDPDPEPEPDPPDDGTIVCEDFSHQNITNYYDGADMGYGIDSRWSTRGEYSCANLENDPGQIWTTNLDDHPMRGDTFRIDMRSSVDSNSVSNTHRIRHQFGHTSAEDLFAFYIDLYTNRIYAFERHDGSWTTLAQGNCARILADTDFYAEVEWDSTTSFSVQYFDKNTGNSLSDRITANAQNHATVHGGFGLAVRSLVGEQLSTDNVRVIERSGE